MLIGTTDEPHQLQTRDKKMTQETTVTKTKEEMIVAEEERVRYQSARLIAEEMVERQLINDELRSTISSLRANNNTLRTANQELVNTITEFLKEHIAQEDSATVDELKDLADSLDIELTKDVKVVMDVTVEVTLTVPIDFDEDDIDENDFTISAEFDGKTDCEEVNTDITVERLRVEDGE